jgi:hypothetical protein
LLGDMVAKRLARGGQERAWDDFKHAPSNHALTEKILQQILQEDSEFRTRLEEALIAAMQENAGNSQQYGNIHVTGPGQTQIGSQGDNIEGTRFATRGGTYNERTHISHKTNKKTSGGSVVALGMVALIVLVILLVKGVPAVLHRIGGGGLSANSTCQDFLNSSPAAQQAIVDSLAAQYNKPDYTTPLGEPDVPYYCASNPSTTLGQFFANAQP